MRILYLIPYKLYCTKMSVGRTLYGDAMARQPGVKLEYWGQGWPDYHDDSSLLDNLIRRKREYEAYWFYKADTLIRAGEAPGVRFLCFNEAWAPKTLQEIDACRPTFVVFHHEGDIRYWDEELIERGSRAVHFPHCAEMSFYLQKIPLGERPIACLLTGVMAPEVYPLRERFRRLIAQGRIPGMIRPHPGYRLENRGALLAQYADYAAQLQRAKIALCCTSRHRYFLQKIVEAGAAGCLIVTDRPEDSAFDPLSGSALLIGKDWSDDDIAQAIHLRLSEPSSLQNAADDGWEAVSHYFTTDHYADRILRTIRQAGV